MLATKAMFGCCKNEYTFHFLEDLPRVGVHGGRTLHCTSSYLVKFGGVIDESWHGEDA